MKIKLGGYGILKNYTGTPDPNHDYQLDHAKPIREIIKDLGIPEGMVMLVSVNDTQKNFDYIPQEGDDIKFIPPVSGG